MDSQLAEQYQFEVCLYPGPSVGVSGRVIRKLRSEVRALVPDLVHLHGLQTEGFNCMMGAALAGRSPRLLTVHGFIEDAKFRTPWRRQIIASVLEPLTLRLADAVFSVSRYGMEKAVMRRLARGNLGFINNALPGPPPLDAVASRAIRQRYGWADLDIVVICVARLSREKGLLDLIEAFESLGSREPRLRLLLVGDGPDTVLIKNRLGTSMADGRAAIHSATPDVMPLLGACDLFVLPSLHENQSFAILEAMAAGLPVVSTSVGGTPELIMRNETGLLVSPGEPAQLADAIQRLASSPDLRRRLGLAGQRAVERNHSFEHFVDQLGAVYRRMLPPHAGRR